MTATLIDTRQEHGATRRARIARPSVRAWTGRSAMTVATDSGLPRVKTAGTRQTRVSAMRPLAVRAAEPAVGARAGADAPHTFAARRSLASGHRQHRWRG